jgi:hypothetical protein
MRRYFMANKEKSKKAAPVKKPAAKKPMGKKPTDGQKCATRAPRHNGEIPEATLKRAHALYRKGDVDGAMKVAGRCKSALYKAFKAAKLELNHPQYAHDTPRPKSERA